MHLEIPRSSKWFPLVILTCLLPFTWNNTATGQNLVPNPSFEEYLNCPYMINAVPFTAPPWVAAFGGTPDYYNACMNSYQWQFGVPTNAQGYQEAHTGVAYSAIFTYAPGITWVKEYLQVALTEPLEAGQCYIVSFYANLTDVKCGSDKLGALLSIDLPSTWMGEIPQVQFQGGYLSDTANWVHVYDYYTAVGGEQYITIGNFYTDDDTSGDPACTNTPPFSYYFIDDVAVIPPSTHELDLGGPVTACDSFVIDPGFTDAIFEWSDGSAGPTLTVHTSGTYSVVAYFNCEIHTDNIEVTIYNNPPVDLIDELPIECSWDSYTITLDPDMGIYEWQDGSTGNEFTISADGTYYVTLDDGCDLTSDTLHVDLLDGPLPFSLGEDTILCAGDVIQLSLNPSLGEFEWQDQSTDNTYSVSSAGTYSVTVTNICGSTSDEIEILPMDIPSVNLGPDTSALCPGEILVLEPATQTGTYLWQDGSTNTSFEVTETGLYTLSITNICGSDINDIYVYYIQPPFVELGPVLSLCAGDTIILSSQGNKGNFLWQDGSTSETFAVTDSGTYSLKVTNICGQSQDTVDIALLPQITPPELGPDLELCPGQQAILHAGTQSANYLWNDMSTADSLIVTTAGVYFVQVSNACNTFTDTVHVTIASTGPQLDLMPDFQLCQGDTVIVDAGISNVIYQWNDNSNLSSITIFNPGTYALTVSNSCGMSSDSIVVSDGGPLPMVELGHDTMLCPGASFLLAPAFANVDTWMWGDGTNAADLTVTSAGTITIAVNNACGAAMDTLTVTALPGVPDLFLGMDTSICPGTTLILSIPVADVDIQWSDGGTDSLMTVSDSALIIASISNSCGVSMDTLEVSLLPDVPEVNLGQDLVICPGETITLDPGIPNVTYSWQDGSTSTTYAATQEGLIILTLTNSCGQSSDSLWITESTDGPHLDLGPDVTACEGETITILAGIGGVDYVWQDGSDANQYLATASGTYSLTVTNSCGTDKDSIVVNLQAPPPPVYLGPDTTLCDGESTLLTAPVTAGSAILWQDGSSTQTFLVTMPGLYTLQASNLCGTSSDSILIAYQHGPVPFELGADTILCPGETLSLIAPVTSDLPEWQDGSTGPVFVVRQSGLYSLTLTNACGEIYDEISVSYNEDIPVFPPDDLLKICPNEQILLDATQAFPTLYSWSTGSGDPVITITTPDHYTVTVYTPCLEVSHAFLVAADTDCNTVEEEEKEAIFFPNVISPNGDGINDMFTYSVSAAVELLSADAMIFDRWGNKVYETKSIPVSWDGTFRNKSVPPAVYVYRVVLTYAVNGVIRQKSFHGDITVIK